MDDREAFLSNDYPARPRRDVVLDVSLVWIITILAYLAVGILRTHQFVRSVWGRLRPERKLLE